MTRDERLARRRARGDARARVAAIPRTIDPFTKKPHPRFFELRASISRLSPPLRLRLRARAASDLTRPSPRPPTASFPQKHKKGQGDDKAKEKDVPAWWRYVDPFFREVHAGDLHAVLPPRRWDDDPDLRLPPLGRKHGVRLRRRARRVHHRRPVHPAGSGHSARDASRGSSRGLSSDPSRSAPARLSARARRASGPRAA